jgi:23S rRNA (uracil1939-C5)-methyltransferase
MPHPSPPPTSGTAQDHPGDPPAEHLELDVRAPANGGAGIARHPDGRVVLVDGALPGERVAAEVHERRRDFLRARVVDVLDASPDRVTPPCPHVSTGCGGCDLQHLAPAVQPALKRAVVLDALRRIGGLVEPVVSVAPALPASAYRTTVRAAVVDGLAGYRGARSHEVVPVSSCLVAHPAVEDLLVGGRFDGCQEVTIRVGAATGERLVVASPSAAGVVLPPEAAASTTVVGDDELTSRAGRRGRAAAAEPHLHEVVAGRRFRISARSFFQARPDGAAALVEQVRRAGGAELAGAAHVVDAYAGVGLFAATVVPETARLTAVESNRSSVADARHNLRHRAGRPSAGEWTAVIGSTVERWRAGAAEVVVADPARRGLGRPAADVLAATGAGVLVLVSCEAAALARDARLLAAHGFRHRWSVLVDLFPHTHHVEVVTRFERASAP